MRKLILCFLIVMPLTAFGYVLLQKLPGLNAGTEGPKLTDYLGWLFRFMLVFAAFAAVVQIVIGGIQMMIGGASETQRTNAKSRIQDAIYGLLLALAAWLILWTINPNLAQMKLTIPEVIIKVTAPATAPSTACGVPTIASHGSCPGDPEGKKCIWSDVGSGQKGWSCK